LHIAKYCLHNKWIAKGWQEISRTSRK